jgi:nitroimidazol reductase NimA-like FMN-containing flavoprotein (pyridoxamine 5'-phosphate oxidase superfamily)
MRGALVSGADRNINNPRRKDRLITDENRIRALLDNAPYGVFAASAENQPYIHVNTFVYDRSAHAIYFHTAKRGRLRDTVDSNPRAAFTVCSMGRLLPADRAKEFSVEYASVVVYGDITIVSDPQAANDHMSLLMDKYFSHLKPGIDYHPITDREIREISVYKLAITSWSGKEKSAPSDFPGAFNFGEDKGNA